MRGIVTIGLALGWLAMGLPAGAAPATGALAGLMNSCETQMYMSAAACSCLVAKAQTELDARQIAYLTIPGDNGPQAAAAAKAMRGPEIAQIDKFMRTVPDQCQKAH